MHQPHTPNVHLLPPRRAAIELGLAAGTNLAREYAWALRELLPDSGFTEIAAADLAEAVVAGHTLVLNRP